jgi:hypothetical protein
MHRSSLVLSAMVLGACSQQVPADSSPPPAAASSPPPAVASASPPAAEIDPAIALDNPELPKLFCDGIVHTEPNKTPSSGKFGTVGLLSDPDPAGLTRPPSTIQSTVRAQFAALRECYELALNRHPAIHGKVSTRFVIEASGKTAAVCLDFASLIHQPALACMLDVYARLDFAPADGKMTVIYPIGFSPDEPQ